MEENTEYEASYRREILFKKLQTSDFVLVNILEAGYSRWKICNV